MDDELVFVAAAQGMLETRRGEASSGDDAGRLAAAMADAYARARQVWSEIELAPASFARALVEVVATQPDLLGAVGQVGAADLYLAAACADGNVAALSYFEDRYIRPLPRLLAPLRLPAEAVEEVQQQVRDKLLVAAGDGAPRLSRYAGRGNLRTLVGAVAMRTGLRHLRQRGKLVDLGERAMSIIATSAPDPELAGIKQQYRTEFRSAFESSIAELSARERNILRFLFVDGLTVDRVAAFYGVHRTTVSRWLSTIRAKLAETMRQSLATRLGVDEAELASMIQLIQSKLELSFDRLL